MPSILQQSVRVDYLLGRSQVLPNRFAGQGVEKAVPSRYLRFLADIRAGHAFGGGPGACARTRKADTASIISVDIRSSRLLINANPVNVQFSGKGGGSSGSSGEIAAHSQVKDDKKVLMKFTQCSGRDIEAM